MISTKKDAATIRATIQRLRTAPTLSLRKVVPLAFLTIAEYEAQQKYIDWAESYLIGNLLAMLPDVEKPNNPAGVKKL